MINKKTTILFILIVFNLSYFSQNKKLDSLRNILKQINLHDTTLIKLYGLIGEQIYDSQPDTAIKLWEKTISICEKKIKLKLSEKEKRIYLVESSNAYNNIGFIQQQLGKPDLALYYLKKSLHISELLNDYENIAITYNNIGYNLVHIGNTSEALNFYNKTLLVNTKYGTKKQIIGSLVVMGDQYSQMNDFKNAVIYLEKALNLAMETNDFFNQASIYIQLGNVYKKAGNIISSINSYLKSLDINKKINNLNGIATCYNNLGTNYYEMHDHEKALHNFKKSLTITEKLNRVTETHNKLINIGATFLKLSKHDSAFKYLYQSLKFAEETQNKQLIFVSLSNICQHYYNENNNVMAEKFGLKAQKVSNEMGFPQYIKTSADLLKKIYAKKGNYKEAFKMYHLFIKMKDSLNNKETQKAGINSQLRYEYDLKTMADSLKIVEERKLNYSKSKQEKVQRYALFTGIIIIAIFAGFIYDRFKKTQKQKVIIELKEKETQQQKELLQNKNKEILDSINYAKRLQEAILPSQKIWEGALPNSFIFYQPKDIVAGDFYWLEKIEDKILFAAADCTGHGVPGALVSVVCSNALNRVVKEFGVYQPNEILSKVRELVIETFEKSETEVKDGMDISLCCFDRSTNVLTWAGAYNPLWIIQNNYLKEIKADKQPIGKHIETKAFTNHRFQLNKGDSIYIFTDGFADQFGGPKGKKFKQRQFKNILIEISNLEPENQKIIIAKVFTEWKNSLEQVDDVCVIGLKI